MKKKQRWNLSVIYMTVVPVILMGIIISVAGYFKIRESIYEEVDVELHNLVTVTSEAYGQIYPGDYKVESENLYKGDICITNNHQYLDRFQQKTGMDISVCYGNVRYATTICDANEERGLLSETKSFIFEQVKASQETVCYRDVFLGDEMYFAVYAPLKNTDGTIVGMMEIAKPAEDVQESVAKAIFPVFIITFVIVMALCICMMNYFNQIAGFVRNIEIFMQNVAKGNLNTSISESITRREDEFGEIGRAAQNMQNSLRQLLEYDMLTEVYNRGYGEKKLQEVINTAKKEGLPYCVAIADIDFFKKVNDTYGHEAGDEVLRQVAAMLKRQMSGNGYTVRWGGEEFLLVFRNRTYKETYDILEDLEKKIRESVVEVQDKQISVTMTIGVVKGKDSDTTSDVVRRADHLLYKGKTHGRNQIYVE